MSRVTRSLVTAVLATAVAVGGGVALLGADDDGGEAQTAESTPLTEFDTSAVTILRTGFCDEVADEAVRDALGAEPDKETSYLNGDRVRLARGVRDRAHEFGCSWSGGGAKASAWVYAPPITRNAATELVRRAAAAPGCSRVSDAPEYGEPSAGLVCTGGGGQEVSFRGLFGDAWLVCSLRTGGVSAGQDGKSLDRAGRWCVAAARAADDVPRSG